MFSAQKWPKALLRGRTSLLWLGDIFFFFSFFFFWLKCTYLEMHQSWGLNPSPPLLIENSVVSWGTSTQKLLITTALKEQ